MRVLGACNTGSESDLIDGIRWAAGVSPDGESDPLSRVRRNATPARVINLSLALPSGRCDSLMQRAVNDAVAAGAIVVAAAGNDGTSVASPANCDGVIAVGGHSLEDGLYRSRSDYGSKVTNSAPYDRYRSNWAFDSSDLGQQCQISDLRESEGTSFAAALTSGTVALMVAVDPSLTGTRATKLLKRTAV